MSKTTIAGVDDGAGEGTTEKTPTPSEIFNAEVKALEEAEAGGTKRASNYRSVDPARASGDEAIGDEAIGAEASGAEDDYSDQDPDGEQSGADDESEAQGEGQESEESEDSSVNSKRKNWKKEAQDYKQAFDSLKSEVEELKQAMRAPAQEPAKPDTGLKIPEVSLENIEMSQEVKDLLEFTPGFDKLITTLVAQTTKEILEKDREGRTRGEQEAQQARQREETDVKYWNGVNSWLQGQYPDLTLPEIRESPDFADWSKYRESWVNAQLSSVDYDDPSGAQKVIDRYIRENNLAKANQDPEPDRRNLAAARTPAANRRSATPTQDNRSLFQRETERINSKKHRFQTTI